MGGMAKKEEGIPFSLRWLLLKQGRPWLPLVPGNGGRVLAALPRRGCQRQSPQPLDAPPRTIRADGDRSIQIWLLFRCAAAAVP